MAIWQPVLKSGSHRSLQVEAETSFEAMALIDARFRYMSACLQSDAWRWAWLQSGAKVEQVVKVGGK